MTPWEGTFYQEPARRNNDGSVDNEIIDLFMVLVSEEPDSFRAFLKFA